MNQKHIRGITVEQLKYNFVIFFASYDYLYPILGKELYESEYVHIYKGTFRSGRLPEKLFHYHWAYRINKRLDLPLKKIWFKKMYRQEFKHNLPLCFIYLGGSSIRYDGGFTEYVRKQDPRNRQVLYHQDLISKTVHFPYHIVRDKVDLAVTYDEAEAKQHDIHFFQEVCYSKLIPEPDTPNIEQDVYFLGYAKDRLERIMTVYHQLHDQGLTCKFMLAGVPEEQQVPYDGIIYTKGIRYEENLRNVIASKCILEIVQGASSGLTMRACEAIAYRRRLLTDCPSCDEAHFNPGQLQRFSRAEEIDAAFIQKEFDPNDYPQQLDLDPMKRLYDIQEQLEKLNANVNCQSR